MALYIPWPKVGILSFPDQTASLLQFLVLFYSLIALLLILPYYGGFLSTADWH